MGISYDAKLIFNAISYIFRYVQRGKGSMDIQSSLIVIFSVEKAFSPHSYFFEATKIGVFFPQATVTLSNLIVSMHDYP